MMFRRIGSAAEQHHDDRRRQRRGDRRALAQQRRQQRDEAQRHGEIERPRRRDRVAGEVAGECWSAASRPQSTTPPPRKCDAAGRLSSPASKRRIAAANAWSVSRKASSRCQRTGSERHLRRHRGAVHREPQPDDEAGQDDRRRPAHRRRRAAWRGSARRPRTRSPTARASPAVDAPTPAARDAADEPERESAPNAAGSIPANPSRKSAGEKTRPRVTAPGARSATARARRSQLGAEDLVAGVAEPGDDVAVLVQVAVDRRGEHVHVRDAPS